MTTMTRTPPAPLTRPAPAPDHGDDDFIHETDDTFLGYWYGRLGGRIPRARCGVLLLCEHPGTCRCGDPTLPPCPACAARA